ADVQHRQFVGGAAAGIVAAPVHAAHAHEVAAALVIGHRVAAALGAGFAPGGIDETAEVPHRHLGDRHRETARETDRMLRALDVRGVGVALGGAHAEGPVRYHHHLRPA